MLYYYVIINCVKSIINTYAKIDRNSLIAEQHERENVIN